MLAFTNISCTVKQLWVVSIHQTMFLFHFDLLFLQQLHFFPWQSYIISCWIWVPFPLCLSLKVTVGDSWEFTSSKDTILKLHPPKQPHSAVWNKTEPVSGTTSKWPIFPVDFGFSCSTILITIINKVSEKPLCYSLFLIQIFPRVAILKKFFVMWYWDWSVDIDVCLKWLQDSLALWDGVPSNQIEHRLCN